MHWEDHELKNDKIEMEQLERKEAWDGLWSDYQSTASVVKEDEGADFRSRWKAIEMSNVFFAWLLCEKKWNFLNGL